MKIKPKKIIRKMGFLAKEKDLIVWRGEREIETTITLNERKGLIVSLYWNEQGNLEVMVQKTVNGCPGCGKPELRKVYRK